MHIAATCEINNLPSWQHKKFSPFFFFLSSINQQARWPLCSPVVAHENHPVYFICIDSDQFQALSHCNCLFNCVQNNFCYDRTIFRFSKILIVCLCQNFHANHFQLSQPDLNDLLGHSPSQNMISLVSGTHFFSCRSWNKVLRGLHKKQISCGLYNSFLLSFETSYIPLKIKK